MVMIEDGTCSFSKRKSAGSDGKESFTCSGKPWGTEVARLGQAPGASNY